MERPFDEKDLSGKKEDDEELLFLESPAPPKNWGEVGAYFGEVG